MHNHALFRVFLCCFVTTGSGGPALAQFTEGDAFVSSSWTDEVRIYDATTLAFKSAFSHP